MRTCCKCKQPKPLSEFSPTSKYKGKIQYRGDCKCCNAKNRRDRYRINPAPSLAASKKWKLENPDRIKFTRILCEYNLTRKAYESLLTRQNNLCAICGRPFIKSHIDHDHKTGKVRGILCITCNTGLGKFNDSVELLYKAIRYQKNLKVDTCLPIRLPSCGLPLSCRCVGFRPH